MERFKEALERGKAVREKQDKVLALFVKHLHKITDLELLEDIERELGKEGVK